MILNTEIIPQFHNNYSFVLYTKESKKALLIDPGEAKPIQKFLKRNNLTVDQIWLTHYHYDHCEATPELVKEYGCNVFGPCNAPDNFSVHVIDKKNKLSFQEAVFQVIETPGHVKHHLSYYNASNRMLFPGDTLFGGGAAVVINDTASRLWQTMQKLRILPNNTRVFFPHEVTTRNIRFALSLDPDNDALKLRYNFTKAQIRKKVPTCPSMLQMEKQTNPFLRADDPCFQKSIGKEGQKGEDVFIYLMQMLDESYGRSSQ